MTVVDEKGRLFGRLNLIDALVAAVVIGLIPIVYGAFVLFRVPAPTITSVVPGHIDENQTATVQVTGTHLRPFLRAHVGTTPSAAFLIQSPTTGEVHVPALPAGTYDLVLSEEGQELAKKPGAITVAPAPRTDATVRVQFIGTPEAIAQLAPGDVDVPTVSPSGVKPLPGAAVITAIGTERRAVDTNVEYWLFTKNGNGLLDRSFHVPERLLAFPATLTVPVVASPTGWMYKNFPIKVGARFTFESRTGMVVGSILGVDPPAAPKVPQ